MDMMKRDNESSALLNTNGIALQAYKAKRKAELDLKESINTIQRDILEIKNMVKQILSEVQ